MVTPQELERQKLIMTEKQKSADRKLLREQERSLDLKRRETEKVTADNIKKSAAL